MSFSHRNDGQAFGGARAVLAFTFSAGRMPATCKLTLFLVLAIFPLIAGAADITLQGTFTADDNVQLFSVSLAAAVPVDIRSYGYAGGTTSTGTVVPRGGFDTILTLFSASGVFINDNDEGAGVAVDPTTGLAADARLTASLAAGSYIVALTEYDNFSIGNLTDGFAETGNPHFTADPTFSAAGPCPGNMFRDISGTAGRCRSGNWTVDFVNVTNVTPVAATPEPSALLLASVGLGLLLAARFRNRKKITMLAVAFVVTLASAPVQAQPNCPAIQSNPDYCHASDFLNGQRTLLKVTDMAIAWTLSDTIYRTQITTSNSSQTVQANPTNLGSVDGTATVAVSAHMFSQPGASTLTGVEYYSNPGFSILLQNVDTLPSGNGVWPAMLVQGNNPYPYVKNGAAADFTQDGYDEGLFSFDDGTLLVVSPNDPTDASKGFRTGRASLDLLKAMTTGDFNGDGMQEIAGLFVSSTGELNLIIYTVDPTTLIPTRAGAPLALTASGVSAANPITSASIAAGKFNTATHNQLAVTFATNSTSPIVEIVDFAANSLTPSTVASSVFTPTTVTIPSGYLQVKTGKFALPGNPNDQIVFHMSSVNGGGKFFEILTPDMNTLALTAHSGVTYDQFPCAAGIQVGNFDHRQPDPTTSGQTEHNPNDQVALMYCNGSSTGNPFVYYVMNIYSVDTNFNVINPPDSILDLSGQVFTQPFLPVSFVATDIQGRSLVLGTPTKISIDSTIVPNAIIGAPPMHIDFISSAPLSGAPAELFNLSVVPDSFNTTYEQDTSSGTTTSTTNKTSWSFGAKESISGSLTVGDPDEEGIKVSDTLTAAQNLKSESEAAYGTSTSSTFSLTTSTGLGDQVVYTDSQFNIWVYPVIGQTVCPSGNPGCSANQRVPLTIQFSAPDGSANAINSPGANLPWYQPPWEPGNIFSYPSNAAQVQAIFPNLTSLTNTVEFATTSGGVLEQATWSGQSQNSSTASFDQDYSFDNDFSVTGAAGFAGISGGFSYGLDISGSYGLSTLSQTTNQIASSTGLKIQVPGTVANPSNYGYLISPSIMGTTVGPNVVDSPPDTSSKTSVQTYGRLYAMYWVDPLNSSLGAGPWWRQAYTAAPDVALNHPRRWTSTATSLQGSVPSNCLAIGGSAGGGQYDCVTLNTPTPSDPLGDDFHIMRGFFISKNNTALPENPGSQNKGPQLEYARTGDDLFLTARVYNYSLADMPTSTQVHARFYYMLWNTQNAAPVDPNGASTFIGEAMTAGPIPKFDTTSSQLNWTLLGLDFNTADATNFPDIQGGDVALVFWVVVWMQDSNGFVMELPNHGLTGIPGTFASWVDAANFECPSATNCYSNNLGVFPQVLFLGGAKGSVPPGPAPVSASVDIGKLDLSAYRVALTQKVTISGTVSAQDADAGTMSVNFYDGDPNNAGQLFDVERIAHVTQGRGYKVAASYRPKSCGTHELFAVINQGKPSEVVRRAPPLRVACNSNF